ncbi:MAG: ATP-binding protein [Planctomycetes bacterium]|nr:ATP-binding protein [Planctomycetota bacterium]
MAPVRFLAATDPEPESIGSLWDRIVLTPEEARVADALRLIDERIERVAPMVGMGALSWWSLVARLRGSDTPVPLGSLGEGMRRLLMLAVSVSGCGGGTLLVDDIDTGLHHSVMLKMWRMLVESARRLQVQVFATTHSYDCLQALAQLYEGDASHKDAIVVHRIEQAREATTPYSAEEILVAARHEMEIR